MFTLCEINLQTKFGRYWLRSFKKENKELLEKLFLDKFCLWHSRIKPIRGWGYALLLNFKSQKSICTFIPCTKFHCYILICGWVFITHFTVGVAIVRYRSYFIPTYHGYQGMCVSVYPDIACMEGRTDSYSDCPSIYIYISSFILISFYVIRWIKSILLSVATC